MHGKSPWLQGLDPTPSIGPQETRANRNKTDARAAPSASIGPQETRANRNEGMTVDVYNRSIGPQETRANRNGKIPAIAPVIA